MKKILIIDDDKIFLKIFRDTFSKSYADKYEVVSAEDGEEGLLKVGEEHPDLIVLDIKMPKMDGLEFLRALKEKNGESQTPVLISSNFSDNEKISEGLELGVKGYVVKSDYSLDGIIARIEDILGSS
ncbi:MAG: response regulator [Candidatus Pacebacteria bacterium]|nr:response regulator [Candidatus Paceibacterota bacterium]